MNKNNQDKRGFSLVEVMIAMSIFVFGAMAIYALQIHSMKISAAARRLSTATDLAQYPIEAFKAAPFLRSFEPVSSAGLAQPYSWDIDLTPPSSATMKVFYRITTQWKDLFGNGNSYDSYKSFGKTDFVKGTKTAPMYMGKGRIIINIHNYTPPMGSAYNDYADLRAIVWWCDGQAVTATRCLLTLINTADPINSPLKIADSSGKWEKTRHFVEAKQRYMNIF